MAEVNCGCKQGVEEVVEDGRMYYCDGSGCRYPEAAAKAEGLDKGVEWLKNELHPAPRLTEFDKGYLNGIRAALRALGEEADSGKIRLPGMR